jgi:parallel beta-helix repeat protein
VHHRSIRPPVAVDLDTAHDSRRRSGANRIKVGVMAAALVAGLLLSLLLAVPGAAQEEDAVGACDEYATTRSSVQQLVDSLSSGEVGCLRGGTYTAPNGSLKLRTAGITLRSAPNEQATLEDHILVDPRAEGVTVSGLRIEGTPGKANVLIRADNTRWFGNDVTNYHRDNSCFLLGGYGSTGTLIEGNRIHNCGPLPRTNHNHGIYVSNSTDAKIIDNFIYDNADRGVQLYPNSNGTLVEGNVVDGNGQNLVINKYSSDNTVRNNVFSNPAASWNVNLGPDLSGTGNRVTNNCFWAAGGASRFKNSTSNSVVVSGNVTANPLYEDRRSFTITNPTCLAKYGGTLAR